MILSALKRTLLGGAIGTLSALGGAQAGNTLFFESGNYSPQTIHQKTQALSLGMKPDSVQTRYFVIQFKDRISEAIKDELLRNQTKIHRYIPDDALLVSGDSESLIDFSVKHRSEINGVVPYLPGFKLSKSLQTQAQGPVKVVLEVFKSVSPDEVEQELSKLDIDVERVQGRYFVIKAHSRELSRMAAIDGVEHIEAFKEMKRMDMVLTDEGNFSNSMRGDYSDLTGFETGTQLMGFPKAWEKGFTGLGQRVAIADTGLDIGALEGLSGDFTDVIFAGHVHGAYATDWSDPVGHGTHVAGSVAGRGVASSNVLTGGAYQSDLVIQALWSSLMGTLSVPENLSDLFQEAYDDGARIHTNSWGSAYELGAYDAFAQQVDEFMWEHPDMLILFAAGNSGEDKDLDGRIDSGSVSSPGTAKNALTVGASENTQSFGGMQRSPGQLNPQKWGAPPISDDNLSDNENGLAMFSSRGPTLDGRTKPEIVAPGTNILSVRSHALGAGELWGAYNDDYAFSGGTSMSTPLTAGAAAVAREFLMKQLQFESPSSALVKATLMNTAVEMFPGQFGEVGEAQGQEILTPRPNSDEGFGRVDISNVTRITDNASMVDYKQGLTQGETYTYNLYIAEPTRVAITMVYTDAPASPSAGKALVNNLDLTLSSSEGELQASSSDLDNFEHIEQVLPAGAYSVEISADNVPQGRDGKQDFALVVTQQAM